MRRKSHKAPKVKLPAAILVSDLSLGCTQAGIARNDKGQIQLWHTAPGSGEHGSYMNIPEPLFQWFIGTYPKL